MGITVSFSSTVQELGALQEAAYRLIGTATCIIDEAGGYYHCTLEPNPHVKLDDQLLRARYCDLVTDENLRAKISTETRGVRDVILSLAFGALVEQKKSDETR